MSGAISPYIVVSLESAKTRTMTGPGVNRGERDQPPMPLASSESTFSRADAALVRNCDMPSRPFTASVVPFVNCSYQEWNAPEAASVTKPPRTSPLTRDCNS